MTYSKHTTAGCIIYRQAENGNEFLLIFRKWDYKPNGAWILPKGHIKEGETLEQAALRETIEETGYTNISIVSFLKEIKISYEFDREHHDKEINWFLAKLNNSTQKNKKLSKSEEKSNTFCLYWKHSNEIEELLTFDNDKEIARLALDYLSKN